MVAVAAQVEDIAPLWQTFRELRDVMQKPVHAHWVPVTVREYRVVRISPDQRQIDHVREPVPSATVGRPASFENARTPSSSEACGNSRCRIKRYPYSPTNMSASSGKFRTLINSDQ